MDEEQLLTLISEAVKAGLENKGSLPPMDWLITGVIALLFFLMGRLNALHHDLASYRKQTLNLLEKIYQHLTKGSQ